MDHDRRTTRYALAAVALTGGLATVLNLLFTARGTLTGAMLGLWLAGPMLGFGALQLLLARAREVRPLNAGRVVGLWAAALVMTGLIALSQVVVATDKSSTAALLYLFAPLYASVLGGLAWLASWGVTAGVLRLVRG